MVLYIKGKNLAIPENIIFLFQPPYSPEVNPIERLWLEIKKDLKWEIFDDLDQEKLEYVLIRGDRHKN